MKSVDGSLNAFRTDYIEVNAVHRAAPNAAIAFNTRPEDTAEAAARWLRVD
jgi:aryl-alcohol dehydrogenase-like predicted oxidoreductase